MRIKRFGYDPRNSIYQKNKEDLATYA